MTINSLHMVICYDNILSITSTKNSPLTTFIYIFITITSNKYKDKFILYIEESINVNM